MFLFRPARVGETGHRAGRRMCYRGMRRMRKAASVDILHLRYFSSVYESLNYSKSATDLFVSRQALRQAMQNLEREIGQTLFRNEANKLVATSPPTFCTRRCSPCCCPSASSSAMSRA